MRSKFQFPIHTYGDEKRREWQGGRKTKFAQADRVCKLILTAQRCLNSFTQRRTHSVSTFRNLEMHPRYLNNAQYLAASKLLTNIDQNNFTLTHSTKFTNSHYYSKFAA